MKTYGLKTVLVLGSSGYIGKLITNKLTLLRHNYVTYTARYPLNIQHLKDYIIQYNVSGIINCAGATGGDQTIDYCADNKIQTMEANVFLPTQIAQICKELGIMLYHVSSGCIFNDENCAAGRLPVRQFTEEDLPNFSFDSGNCSWYSGTKALSERTILSAADGYARILRIRMPYDSGKNSRSFLSKIIKYPVLLNATNSFTDVDEFTDNIISIWHNKYDIPYITNMVQPGYINTKELVDIMTSGGLLKEQKEFFRDINDFNRTVKERRSNCVLSSDLAVKHVSLTPLRKSLERAIDLRVSGYKLF